MSVQCFDMYGGVIKTYRSYKTWARIRHGHRIVNTDDGTKGSDKPHRMKLSALCTGRLSGGATGCTTLQFVLSTHAHRGQFLPIEGRWWPEYPLELWW